MWRLVRMPPPQPCKLWKAMNREVYVWGYNWATLSLGDINTHIGTWSSRLGLDKKLTPLLCKKLLLQNPKK
jgi:hypothetical protein